MKSLIDRRLTRAQLKEKELNLITITDVLERAFEFMTFHKNIVITMGNSGCGKSTMLSSLLFGKDCLEQKDIVMEITNIDSSGNEVKKDKKCKVIDIKEQFKDIIPFKIGHSKAASETLYPQRYKVEGQDYNLVDVAGLCDTGGSLIDFIVSFLNKKLFTEAKNVRFLVPMTMTQVKDNRGHGIIDQF